MCLKKDISSIKEKYEILTKTAFDKCFREKYEIDESDAVQYVRRRRFWKMRSTNTL